MLTVDIPSDLDALDAYLVGAPGDLFDWRSNGNIAMHLLSAMSATRVDQLADLARRDPTRRVTEWIHESWCDTAAVLVEWIVRYCPKGENRAASPVTVGRAISYAHNWARLSEAADRCRTGGTDTYRAVAGAARFTTDRSRHRWAVQALQMKLDRSQSESLFDNREPDREVRVLRDFVVDTVRRGRVDDARTRRQLDRLIVWYGRAASERLSSTVSTEYDLDGFTLADGLRLLGQLSALAHVGDFMLAATRDSLWGVIGGRRVVLTSWLGTAADVDPLRVGAFLDMMTFRPGRRGDARLAPMFEQDDRMTTVSALLTGEDAEVRLLRLLASRNPAVYGAIGQVRGQSYKAFVEEFRKLPHVQVAGEVKVHDRSGRVLGDIDVLVADVRSATYATVEVKAPLDVVTGRGLRKTHDELRKGQAQSERLAEAVRQGARVALPANFPDVRQWRCHRYVGTLDYLPAAADLWTGHAIPISLQQVKAYRRASPTNALPAVALALNEPSLPREGEDWIVRPYRSEGPVMNVDQDGLHSRWHAHGMEAPYLAARSRARNSVIVRCPWHDD